MYVISINSRDGKPVIPAFVVESLDGFNDLYDRARSVGAVVIVDSIAAFSSASSASVSLLSNEQNG